jgi:dipeptidase D
MSSAPNDVLAYFADISRIPRRSGQEARVRQWIEDWARQRDFAAETDAVGNLLVRVPGSPKSRRTRPVVLQSHLDMVCEKRPDSPHDFDRDPIDFYEDGEWLKARGTTLGADNGIGVALSLALAADDSYVRPPLELLFTVDEETGLTGATGLREGWLRGDVLLNVDSEDEGVFTVGCAGGKNSTARVPLDFEAPPPGGTGVRLAVSGLKGGHSGVDIKLQRANAIRLLFRTIESLGDADAVRLARVSAGRAHNAIPRDAEALLWVRDAARASAAARAMEAIFRREFRGIEETVLVTVSAVEPPARVTTGAAHGKAVALVLALPHGVHGMSAAIAGLVETSNNLATLALDEHGLELVLSHRSSVLSRLDEAVLRSDAIVGLAGGTVLHDGGYPPWEPRWDSPLLQRSIAVYEKLFEKKPIVEVIHAGLECGVIGRRYPAMDMISYGPTVQAPHSPDERLKLSDLPKLRAFSVALLESLANESA